MPPEITVAVVGLVVAAISGLSGFLGGRFKNQTERDKNKIALETQKAEIQAANDAQNAKNQEAIRDILRDYAKRLGDLNQQVANMQTSLSTTQDELIAANHAIEALESQLHQRIDEIEILNQKIKDKELASEERDRQIKELQKQQSDLSERLKNVEAERDRLQATVTEQEKTIAKQQQDIASLNQQLEELRSRQKTLENTANDHTLPAPNTTVEEKL